MSLTLLFQMLIIIIVIIIGLKLRFFQLINNLRQRGRNTTKQQKQKNLQLMLFQNRVLINNSISKYRYQIKEQKCRLIHTQNVKNEMLGHKHVLSFLIIEYTLLLCIMLYFSGIINSILLIFITIHFINTKIIIKLITKIIQVNIAKLDQSCFILVRALTKIIIAVVFIGLFSEGCMYFFGDFPWTINCLVKCFDWVLIKLTTLPQIIIIPKIFFIDYFFLLYIKWTILWRWFTKWYVSTILTILVFCTPYFYLMIINLPNIIAIHKLLFLKYPLPNFFFLKWNLFLLNILMVIILFYFYYYTGIFYTSISSYIIFGVINCTINQINQDIYIKINSNFQDYDYYILTKITLIFWLCITLNSTLINCCWYFLSEFPWNIIFWNKCLALLLPTLTKLYMLLVMGFERPIILFAILIFYWAFFNLQILKKWLDFYKLIITAVYVILLLISSGVALKELKNWPLENTINLIIDELNNWLTIIFTNHEIDFLINLCNIYLILCIFLNLFTKIHDKLWEQTNITQFKRRD